MYAVDCCWDAMNNESDSDKKFVVCGGMEEIMRMWDGKFYEGVVEFFF